MFTVGLTGGIASGKSLAAAAFAALGVPVLDADRVARDVVARGSPALARIREKFGDAFITSAGDLDRRRMREHVFGDPAARQALEAITHPAIRARLVEWRDTQAAPYGVLDVAILVESGLDALVDRVLVIDTPPEAQVRRLVARDGITETLARQMLAAQAPRERRLARADDVILNDALPGQVAREVGRLHELYQALATGGEKPASSHHLP